MIDYLLDSSDIQHNIPDQKSNNNIRNAVHMVEMEDLIDRLPGSNYSPDTPLSISQQSLSSSSSSSYSLSVPFSTSTRTSPEPNHLILSITRIPISAQKTARTNCKSISIPLLANSSPTNEASIPTALYPPSIPPLLSVPNAPNSTRDNISPSPTFIPIVNSHSQNHTSISPLLTRLPPELRQQIYALLLPPCTYHIATQQPYSGSYLRSAPEGSMRTIYETLLPRPARSGYGSNAAVFERRRWTSYMILSSSRPLGEAKDEIGDDDDGGTVHTAILFVCKRIHAEAEAVLYSHSRFDFGIYVEAVRPFWGDRSVVARGCVREMGFGVGIEEEGWEESLEGVRAGMVAGVLGWLGNESMFGGLRTVRMSVLGLQRKLSLGIGEGGVEGDGDQTLNAKVGIPKDKELEVLRSVIMNAELERMRVEWTGFGGSERI